MARPAQDITDKELSVLQALWTQGPATMRQLADALYADPRSPGAVASVQKLLERLEAKEAVVRDRSGPVQTFRAVVARADLIDRRLQGIAEQLCEGSLTPLLTHLVSGQRLSSAERQSLRQLIDELSDDTQ